MIRRPPRSTQSRSSAASDVYKRQVKGRAHARLVLGESNVHIAQRLDPPDLLARTRDLHGLEQLAVQREFLADVQWQQPERLLTERLRSHRGGQREVQASLHQPTPTSQPCTL